MNILIIGGTGLISTAITRFLLERGDSVAFVPVSAGMVASVVQTVF